MKEGGSLLRDLRVVRLFHWTRNYGTSRLFNVCCKNLQVAGGRSQDKGGVTRLEGEAGRIPPVFG